MDTIEVSKRMIAQLLDRASFMLTSWHLWQQLHASIDHPIFRRTQRQYQNLYNALNIIVVIFIASIVTLSATVLLFTSINSTVIVILPLILIAFSSSYVMVWIYRITIIIAIERENRTLDSVSVTPVGQVCVRWMICIATVQHKDALGWIDLSRRTVIGIIWALFMMALFITVAQISVIEISEVLAFILSIVVFGGVIYVEHAQSILIGCLVATWIPNVIPTRIDATIGAILITILLQILTFLLGLVLGGFLQSGGNLDVNNLFNPDFFTINFIVFTLVREALIFMLWRMIAYQSNTNPNVRLMFAN